jgi:mono/diheme cytochrome c family protein
MTAMRRLLLFAFLLPLASACGSAPRSRAEAIAALPGNATAGKATYSSDCASCHGGDGKGQSSTLADGGTQVTFPYLIEHVGEHPAADFINSIITGVPGTAMASYASLSDQQLADLCAYIKTL